MNKTQALVAGMYLLIATTLFSECLIEKETTQGTSIAHSGITIDYVAGTSVEHTGAVDDFFDDATVIPHIGNVVDYTSGTIKKSTGNVIDYTSGLVQKHTDFVVDYARGESVKSTGTVRDYMASENTMYIGNVRDYTLGIATKNTGTVDDVWSNGIVSNKHTGMVTDYNSAGSSSIAHTFGWIDYAGYTVVGGTTNRTVIVDAIVTTRGGGIPMHGSYDTPSLYYLALLSYSNYAQQTGEVVVECPRGVLIKPTTGMPSKCTYTETISVPNECPAGYVDNGTQCEKIRFATGYEYVCSSGYSANAVGTISATPSDPNESIVNDAPVVLNSQTPPVDNCRVTVSYDYYDYTYPDGSTDGFTTFSRTDPDRSTDDRASLGASVNENITSVNNITQYTYDYYSYSCPSGYIRLNEGIVSLTRADGDNAAQNPELGNAANSSTPPPNNCYLDMTYSYFSSNCPSGYTAVDGGLTAFSRIDTDSTTENPELGNDANSVNSAQNCFKDIEFSCYEYTCQDGYNANNTGRSASRCTKTDSDVALRNDAELATSYFTLLPPSKNCLKAIAHNFYEYSCPSAYSTANTGYASSSRVDRDTEVYNPELSSSLNSNIEPEKNCLQNISFDFYEYSCPNPYITADKGIDTSTKTDNDFTADNSGELSQAANSSTEPVDNCSFDIQYSYYEYQYPSGYNVSDSGITTLQRTDPNRNANNIVKLSGDENSQTPPAGNSSRNATYKYYSYECPSSYSVVNVGYANFNKTDTNQNTNDFDNLSRNVNSPTPPSENCAKEAAYSYYSYECPLSVNSQGYSWLVKDVGLVDLRKIDTDINTDSYLDLITDGNSQEPELDNCSRERYVCTLDCAEPLVLEVSSGKCVASLADICIKKGMVYNETMDKCDRANECLDDNAFPEALNDYCEMQTDCFIVDGVCGEESIKTCKIDGFIYNSITQKCEFDTSCSDEQIVLESSGNCGSLPYCDDNKTETITDCKEYETVAKLCGSDDERVGNLCYKSSATNVDITSKRSLIHAQLTGSYKPSSYGRIINSLCAADDKQCAYRLTGIYAAGDNKSLCFEDSNGIVSCVEGDGSCLFSGEIVEPDGIKQILIEDGVNIVGYNKEKQDASLGSIQSTCSMTGKVGVFYGTDVKYDIISAKAENSTIKFWDEYTRGFLGSITILPTIPEADLNEGYSYIQKEAYDLMSKGFVGFYSPENSGSIYAVYKDLISKTACDSLIHGTNFYVAQGLSEEENNILRGMSIKSNGDYNYSDGDFDNGSCVIVSTITDSFDSQLFSMKNVSVHGINTQFVCSPLSCINHKCQYNECPTGFSGNVFEQSYFDSVISTTFPNANINDVCVGQTCDANTPYFEFCGNEFGCSTGKDVYQQSDGSCVEAKCLDNEVLDARSGKCESYGCKNSILRDGKCFKTLN